MRTKRTCAAVLLVAVVGLIAVVLSRPAWLPSQTAGSAALAAAMLSCDPEEARNVDADITVRTTFHGSDEPERVERWEVRYSGDDYHAIRLDKPGEEQVGFDGAVWRRDLNADDDRWLYLYRGLNLVSFCKPERLALAWASAPLTNATLSGHILNESTATLNGETVQYFSTSGDPRFSGTIPAGVIDAQVVVGKHFWVRDGRLVQYRIEYAYRDFENRVTRYDQNTAFLYDYGQPNTVPDPRPTPTATSHWDGE